MGAIKRGFGHLLTLAALLAMLITEMAGPFRRGEVFTWGSLNPWGSKVGGTVAGRHNGEDRIRSLVNAGVAIAGGAVDAPAPDRYKRLIQQRADLVKAGDEIYASPAGEDGALSAEQRGELGKIKAELGEVEADIHDVEEWREARRAVATGRALDDKGKIAAQPKGETPKLSVGEYFQAVAQATSGRSYGASERNMNIFAAASGLNTGSGEAGGFLVQTEHRTDLINAAFGQAVLAPQCTRITVGPDADSIEAPYIDNASRATGSRWGGVQVYRAAEADSVTATKPTLELFELRLADLRALCYATDRSLRDASALGGIIQTAFADEFAFKIDDEIVRGVGGGECVGLLNAGALVSQAKETGQAADTVVYDNIINMWSRVHPRHRANATWYYNVEIEPQLAQLALSVGTGGLEPRFIAYGPGGVLNIYGRPAVAIEQASALGDKGDLFVADLGEYVLIEKGGLESASSMHVRFINHEQTFRFSYSIIGKPKWRTAQTPYKGANTLSPFVTLDARA